MTKTYDTFSVNDFVSLEDDGFVYVWTSTGEKTRLTGRAVDVTRIKAALSTWEGWSWTT